MNGFSGITLRDGLAVVAILTLLSYAFQIQAQEAAITAAPADANAIRMAQEAAKAQAKQGQPGQKPAEQKPGEKPGEEKKEEGKPGEKPAGESDVVKRPAEPPTPADPKELDIRPDETGKMRIQFRNQPWPGVLQWLANVSGLSLDWRELPSDYLNLTTQQTYTVQEARDLLNMHLLARGFTILKPQPEVLSVVKTEGINPGLVPRVMPEQLDERDPHEFCKVTFSLDWLLAEPAAAELKELLSPNGKITPLKTTNRLEVIDAVKNLRDVYRIIQEEQSYRGQERQFKSFVLNHTRADDVIGTLKELLGIAEEEQGPMSPQERQQMMQMRMQQAQQQQQQQGQQNKEPDIHLVADRRKNAILANAPPDKMQLIDAAIQTVDVASNPGSALLPNLTQMQVYRLAAIDPEPLVKTLQSVGDLSPSTHLELDKKNNAIIAYATLPDHVKIRALVDKLDGSGRGPYVIPLRKLAADYVAGTVQFMMGEEEKDSSSQRRPYYYFGYGGMDQQEDKGGKFRVDADVEYNRLLLYANEIEYQQVQDLLVQLGEIRPDGGDPRTVRVIEADVGSDTRDMLKRLQRIWPSMGENELDIQLPEPEQEPEVEEEKQQSEESPDNIIIPAGRRGDALDNVTHVDHGERSNDRRGVMRWAQFTAEGTDTEAEQAEPAVSDSEQSSTEDRVAANENLQRSGSLDGLPYRSRAANKRGAPIQIRQGPNGLIIRSDDTEALDLLEDLLMDMAPPPDDYKIFKVRYVDAYYLQLTLEDIFKNDEEEDSSRRRYPYFFYYDPWNSGSSDSDKFSRLSQRRPIKFISDDGSNSILVQNADDEQLAKISKLIEFYDQPPSNTQTIHQQKIIHLQYSKAPIVGQVVKDTFRDLLSENDKEFDKKKEGNEERRVYYYDWGSDEEDDKKAPQFKGLLSIGVDEISNSLLVSAPPFVMKPVEEIIGQLDEAAKPSSTIKVLEVGQALSGSAAKEALLRALGKAAPPSGGPEKPDQPAEGQPNGNGQPMNGQNGQGG